MPEFESIPPPQGSAFGGFPACGCSSARLTFSVTEAQYQLHGPDPQLLPAVRSAMRALHVRPADRSYRDAAPHGRRRRRERGSGSRKWKRTENGGRQIMGRIYEILSFAKSP